MGKIYVGDIGTVILVDCGTVITGATNTKLKVKKPDGSEVEWTATIDGTQKLKYIVASGDLNVAGTYYLNALLILGSWAGLGETATFSVYDPYM